MKPPCGDVTARLMLRCVSGECRNELTADTYYFACRVRRRWILCWGTEDRRWPRRDTSDNYHRPGPHRTTVAVCCVSHAQIYLICRINGSRTRFTRSPRLTCSASVISGCSGGSYCELESLAALR